VANLDRTVVGQGQRRPRHVVGRRHLDHRQVGLRVGGHNLGFGPTPIVEGDQHLGGAIDHMIVGHNVALVVIDEARSLAGLRHGRDIFRQFEAGDVRHLQRAGVALDLDVDDSRRHRLVERSQRFLIVHQRRIGLAGRRGQNRRLLEERRRKEGAEHEDQRQPQDQRYGARAAALAVRR
jgi:hypothetical protein